jgi:hypothetical protein
VDIHCIFPTVVFVVVAFPIRQGIEVVARTPGYQIYLQLHSVPLHQPEQDLVGDYSTVPELDLQVQASV